MTILDKLNSIFIAPSNDMKKVLVESIREVTHLRAQLAAAEARAERAEAALERVLIGGNHLALLIGAYHPLYTATHEEASRHYANSRDTYEIWCCWKTMMEAGNVLAQIEKETGREW